MSNRNRALVISLIGPAITGLGFAWVLIGAALDPTPDSATLRHYVFDSAHLVIAIGVTLSVLCAPIAIAVAMATPEEVAMPDFAAGMVEEEEAVPAQAPGLAAKRG
jgi:hypothetical protein